LTATQKFSGDAKTVASDTQQQQNTKSTPKTATAVTNAIKEQSDLAAMLAGLSCVCDLPGPGSCLRAGTWLRVEKGNEVAVETIKLRSEVTGFTLRDGLGWPGRLPSAVVPEHDREYRLLLEESPGDVVEAELIRSDGWLESLESRGKGQVYLDLGEVGVRGWAWVLGVHPCPAYQGSGQGCLVTGKFKHSRGRVLELRIAGESRALGITPAHLVWSVDRAAWVMAGELLLGERLLAVDGSTPVVQVLSLCAEPETVYNIEVEGEHCYRVGEQGLLVHNASCPSSPTFTLAKAYFSFTVGSADSKIRHDPHLATG
jgi:hypothetical protein